MTYGDAHYLRKNNETLIQKSRFPSRGHVGTDSDHRRDSSRRRVSNRKLSETMTAMSLAERWMKVSAASRDNNAAARITLT